VIRVTPVALFLRVRAQIQQIGELNRDARRKDFEFAEVPLHRASQQQWRIMDKLCYRNCGN